MKLCLMIFASLVTSIVTGPATAQEQPIEANGLTLRASCQKSEPQCGAYLQGVLDMMIRARHAECGAPRHDREQLRAAYLLWMKKNSYFEDVHMAAGAENALTAAWPCKIDRK